MVQNRVTGRVTAGYKPDLAITTGKIRRSAEACPSRPPSETPESVTLARPDLNHAPQGPVIAGSVSGSEDSTRSFLPSTRKGLQTIVRVRAHMGNNARVKSSEPGSGLKGFPSLPAAALVRG